MVRKFILIAALILTGCTRHEYHGHYKFDESKLKQGMHKEEVVKNFGEPLSLPFLDDISYYLYSKDKINSFGLDETCEAQILRLEFSNNTLVQWESFDYQDYIIDKSRTKEPDMKIKLFFELIEGIAGVTGSETAKETAKQYKSI